MQENLHCHILFWTWTQLSQIYRQKPIKNNEPLSFNLKFSHKKTRQKIYWLIQRTRKTNNLPSFLFFLKNQHYLKKEPPYPPKNLRKNYLLRSFFFFKKKTFENRQKKKIPFSETFPNLKINFLRDPINQT